ncbi:helix-turn-helix domain-containing protein [Paraflavitalea speifideaquila]|uniref:helix-turn-helix domain-containing protein n=1 Tax=Paraflavitalea speifideaquila TaxID=3076558 RepID=UPI0028E912A9|nr:helix-turn-helix domain-containing protein [Paraflavitalea speifideiaquila]
MKGQTNVVQIEGINANALLNAVEDIVSRKLSTINKTEPVTDPEFLTRMQIGELFGVSLPTVHAWTNAGILTAYKIANKTRYKKAEVLAACKPLAGKREERA